MFRFCLSERGESVRHYGMSTTGKQFDSREFFKKIRRIAGKVPFVQDAVALYFCMLDPATPLPAKVHIVAALVYVVVPIDLVPDVIPVLGYADDAAMVAGTIALLGASINEGHHRKAREFLAS